MNFVVAEHITAVDTVSTIMHPSGSGTGSWVSYATSVGFPMDWLWLISTQSTGTSDLRLWIEGSANWNDGSAFAANFSSQYLVVKVPNASGRRSEMKFVGRIWGMNVQANVSGGFFRMAGTGPAPF